MLCSLGCCMIEVSATEIPLSSLPCVSPWLIQTIALVYRAT